MVKTREEKEAFVKKNLGLVHSCANRFRGRYIEYDDLFSAGCVGLLKAIDGFDESRGLMFSTYAVPAILGEIRRLFRDGGAIKVSRSLKELSVRASRERERYMKQYFREPTLSELSDVLEVSQDDLVEALNASLPPVSLTIQDDDGEVQLDLPTEEIEESIGDSISLRDALDELQKDDRELIRLRYFESKTQIQTAKVLGMTQVQVSRREKKLMQTLKTKLS